MRSALRAVVAGALLVAAGMLAEAQPVIDVEAKLPAADGAADDFFGHSVSLSGDGLVALVGAPEDNDGFSSGSAYVLARAGSGASWAHEARLLAADGTARDEFGGSVSLSADGGTALIGAHNNGAGGAGSGSAYVFVRSGTSWSQQAKLLAADREAYDRFGKAVALSGDGGTALVAAPEDDADAGHSFCGAAYVFVRSGASWRQQAKLVLPFAELRENMDFGSSVSLSGDGSVALLGAPGRDAGAAYVFERSAASSTWSRQADLPAGDGAAGDFFGASVSLSADGGTALVGAYGDDHSGDASGSAYVFVRSGASSSWTQQAKLLAAQGAEGTFFGKTVSLSADGTTALVGARLAANAGPTSGSAYFFVRSGSSWKQEAKLRAAGRAGGDEFGHSVALSGGGGVALVGARYDDGGGSALAWTSACPAGQYAHMALLNCTACPAGSFCPEGARAPSECGAGDYCPEEGASERGVCPAGFYCSTPLETAACPAGSYCPEGAAAAIVCSTCADGTPTAACTAEADTQCRGAKLNAAESASLNGMRAGLVLLAVAVLGVLGLAARHAVATPSLDKASSAAALELAEGGGVRTFG